MSAVTHHETTINAPEGQPVIEIIRDFDAPPAAVFRAHADPELFARWIGPRSIATRIEEWSCETGGRWRYAALRDGEEIAAFFGSFHEVRPDERIVQTFTYAGFPDAVALEILTLSAREGGGCRLHALSIGDSVEARDRMIASGMSTGVIEGYEQLDELLADQQK